MSDSSSNGSFLLEELGLNNGSTKEKDKKKSKPKPKKKQASPKRKPLSLDEIMKSMGINTPEEQGASTSATNQNTINNDTNFGVFDNNNDSFNLFPNQTKSQNQMPQQFIQTVAIQPQVNFVYFENRITDYLNAGLKSIIDEFSIELTQLFQFDNQIEDLITSFLDSIKKTIRDEINFSVEAKSSFECCFDPFAPEFREMYLKIEKTKNLSIHQKVTQIRNATASISSYIPTISSRFSHAEVSNELNELSTVRSQYKTAKKKIFQLRRNIFLNQIELECKRQTQKMESEIIQTKLQRLEDNRSKLDIFEDNPSQSAALNQNRKMRKLIHDLSIYARKRKELNPKIHVQEIKDARNEINYYRQLNNYQNNLFENKFEEFMNSKMSQLLLSKSMPPQVFNNNSLLLPQQSQIVPPSSFVQPQPQQIPIQSFQQEPKRQINYNSSNTSKNSKKKSNSTLTGHELIDHVQKQLKKAQENNQTSLDITSQYLSSLKKKERKRAHRHVTQIMDSDYDMNSLFSLT